MTYYEVSDRTLRHYNQMLREGTSFAMRLRSAVGEPEVIEVLVDEEGIAWRDGERIGKAAIIVWRLEKGLPLALVGIPVTSEPSPIVQAPAQVAASVPDAAPPLPAVLTPAVRIKGVSYGYNPATKSYERVDG